MLRQCLDQEWGTSVRIDWLRLMLMHRKTLASALAPIVNGLQGSTEPT